MARRHGYALTLLLLASGCGAIREGRSAASGAPRPPAPLSEVGRLEIGGAARCIATLFTPSAAVTAAHCLPPGMTETTPGDAVFAVYDGGPPHRFPVDRAYAFGAPDDSGRGNVFNGDVAVIHLAQAVPAEVASPRRLGQVRAEAGSEVTFVGMERSGAPPNEVRRVRSWRFDPALTERIMLPGDSGGPLIGGTPGDLGPILGVGSGYATSPCGAMTPDSMVFGDVTRFRADIETAVGASRRRLGVEAR
jgi:uncharacterized protein YceK